MRFLVVKQASVKLTVSDKNLGTLMAILQIIAEIFIFDQYEMVCAI